MRRVSLLCLLLLASILAGPSLGAQSADQLYASGRQAFTDQLWTAASNSFQRLLRDFPDDPRADSAAYMHGVARYNDQDFSGCLNALGSFERWYPDSAWSDRVPYWRGLSYYGLGQWNQAATEFQNQTRLAGGGQNYVERSWLYLGACLENLDDLEGAEDAYHTLLGTSRDYEINARATFRLGQTALATGQPAAALEFFASLAYDYGRSPVAADTAYWMAECQRMLGRDQDAFDLYRDFLASIFDSPYRDRALLEAARLASGFDSPDEALAYLDLRDQERSRASDPESTVANRLRAVNSLRVGLLDDAREAFRAVLQDTDDPAERQSASFDLAQTYLGTRQSQSAIPWLESASSGPRNDVAADALHQAGLLSLDLGNPGEGAEYLRRFASRFPGDERREEALRLSVRYGREAGLDPLADQALDDLIADYPGSEERPSYLFLRAEIALDRGEETQALRDYGEILNRFGRSSWAAESAGAVGFIYASRGEHVRAAGYYQDAADNSQGDDRRQFLYAAAIAHLNGGRADRAVPLFQSLIEEPRSLYASDAAYYLGEAFYDQELYSQAREAYQKAVEAADTKWMHEAQYGIAWTHFRETSWEDAAEAFSHAAESAPTPVLRGRSQFRAGLSLASAGEWERALSDYDAALQVGSTVWREEALYQRSWAYLMLDRREEGTADAILLAREFPGSDLPADLPFRMGETVAATGDAVTAAEWFDLCVQTFPDSDKAIQAALRAAGGLLEAGYVIDAAQRYSVWIASRPQDPAAPAAARLWAEALKTSGNPALASAAFEESREYPMAVLSPVALAWARISPSDSEVGDILAELSENLNLPPAERAEAVLLLAHRYRLDGEFQRSIDLYEVLIRDISGRLGAEAQEGLASSYRDQGLVDEAAEAYLAVPYLFPEEQELSIRALREAEALYRRADRLEEADRVRQRRESLNSVSEPASADELP